MSGPAQGFFLLNFILLAPVKVRIRVGVTMKQLQIRPPQQVLLHFSSLTRTSNQSGVAELAGSQNQGGDDVMAGPGRV